MPPSPLGFTLEVDKGFGLERLEDGLDGPGGLARQDLLQILEPGAVSGFADMLEDEFALGGPLQALDAGVAALFAQGGHEAVGGEDPAPGPLQDPRLHQGSDAGPQVRGNGLLAVSQIQHQEVVGIKAPDLLLADGLKEAQEARVLDLPLQGEPNLVVISPIKGRAGLGFQEASLKDPVEALAASFH